ncbi:MAG: hypothetical protein WC583_03180 [Candidatus Omnitrophota bacterium]
MPDNLERILQEYFHPKEGRPNLQKVPVNYVKRGKVKPEFVACIKRAKQLEQKYFESLEKAQENRVVEQYGVEVLTNDDAEWIIEGAKDFVLEIEEILAS